ncbi:FAD-dependent oxidoreductase [Paraburkholderia dipogonis]|uniref:FAD-dependent oxidoreductase n=1 Tax=Paraburkholderia dipogonis TaxID=1211383 RepID=A0A4Y8MGC5_9BURK|nr:FAD-dependent oxidoreductase [Paraburkholderia dipogonis]TFE36500.1 FAD-dependent oxidoreductase [Paraburkholderia dipogonis]
MTRDSEYDVLVIGAGLAGLTAANKVAEGGLSVRVLEKSSDDAYLCNSRYTGGLFHVAMDDMTGDPSWVRSNLMRVTRNTADPALADALTKNARRTLAWLSAQGVRFIKAGPDGLRRNSLAPPGMRRTGLNWHGRSGDVMLRTLGQRLAARGGQLSRGIKAERLSMEDGRCVGVEVLNGAHGVQQLPARAVVIADGGFQGNLELLRRFISKRPEQLLQRNAQSGQGSGLLMAEAVGAKLIGTDRFYGHVHDLKAMTNPGLWPYPVVDSLTTAGMVLDGRAQRFCDEGLGGVYIANAIAGLDDPLTAVVVFDDATWNGPGRDWILPANPNMVNAGGELISANTFQELARKLNLEPAALQASVESFNRICETGQADGQPPRTTTVYKAWPVRTGPFHAVKLCAGVTYTMGGIATDAEGRVLDNSGEPIFGLYAAGACTGGLEGQGGAAGYSGGLSKSSVFGMLTGESIIRTLGSEQTAGARALAGV